jgi:hypothetical protein
MIVAKPKWQLQKPQRGDTILQKKEQFAPANASHKIQWNSCPYFIPVAHIKQTNLLVLFHQYFFKK